MGWIQLFSMGPRPWTQGLGPDGVGCGRWVQGLGPIENNRIQGLGCKTLYIQGTGSKALDSNAQAPGFQRPGHGLGVGNQGLGSNALDNWALETFSPLETLFNKLNKYCL